MAHTITTELQFDARNPARGQVAVGASNSVDKTARMSLPRFLESLKFFCAGAILVAAVAIAAAAAFGAQPINDVILFVIAGIGGTVTLVAARSFSLIDA